MRRILALLVLGTAACGCASSAHISPASPGEQQAGEQLWLVQYDFDSEDQAYRDEPVSVKVLRTTAGNVVYKPSGKPGSSGSCVLNAAGELVAINVWGHSAGYDSEVGVGVAVWPPWWPLEVR